MVKKKQMNRERVSKRRSMHMNLSSDDSDEDYVVENEGNTSEEDDVENFDASLEETHSGESIDLAKQLASHARTSRSNRKVGTNGCMKRKPAICDDTSNDEDFHLDNDDDPNANEIEDEGDSEGAHKMVISCRHNKTVRANNLKRSTRKARYRNNANNNKDNFIDDSDDKESEQDNSEGDDDDASVDEENDVEEEFDDDFSEENEDDDEFLLEEDDDADEENYKSERKVCSKLRQMKNSRKIGRGALCSRPKKRRSRKNIRLSKRKNTKDCKKKGRGKRPNHASQLRKRCRLDSNSESDSDFDYTISEEEREQVKEANKFCGSYISNMRTLSSKKKTAENGGVKRKGKEKAKEVKSDFVGQVCGICFSEEEKRRSKGTLNCCNHFFCFTCIMEWAKVESRCPLCKQRFTRITKNGRSAKGVDLRNVVVDVPERDQVYQPTDEEIRSFVDPYENVICTECQEDGDDGLMLLCDICDSPAHTYCVGLGRQVPEGNWYCDVCRPWSLDEPNCPIDQGASLTRAPPHNGDESSALDIGAPSPRHQGVIASSPVHQGAATLSGRRQIFRHIQYLFSNRQSPWPARDDPTVQHSRFVGDFQGASSTQPLSDPPRLSLWSENPLTTHEESRIVDERAKEALQSMVVNHLINLSKDSGLGDEVFREIVRSAMQTVLATCGVEQSGIDVLRMVPTPTVCGHFDRVLNGDQSVVNGICSSCFDSLVKDVVKRVLDSSLPHWLRLSL